MKLRERFKTLDTKALAGRIRENRLTAEDQRILLVGLRLLPRVLEAIRKKTLKVRALSEMLWGAKTESARNVLKEIDEQDAAQEANLNAPDVPAAQPLPLSEV